MPNSKKTNKIIYEVKHTFRSLRSTFRTNYGVPGFFSRHPLQPVTFTDTYYDHNCQLAKQGVRLRFRDSEPQLKIYRGGQGRKFASQLITGRNVINEYLQKMTTGFKIRGEGVYMTRPYRYGIAKTEPVQPIAKFTTTRDTWIVDNEFTITVDRTDFGHVIGEVEYGGSKTKISTALKQHLEEGDGPAMDYASEQIEKFMSKYDWAFDTERPARKLTAYFRKYGFPKTH